MPSQKTKVIAHIFRRRYDAASGTLRERLVTFDDLEEAMREAAPTLSRANVANFWKDLTRGDLNANWPAEVFQAGFTGDGAAGEGIRGAFRFVPVSPVQETPFPAPFGPADALLASPPLVESLSMPLATKALGRRDENWLAQVANRLHVVESHFAHFSPRNVTEVTFLQTGVKLTGGEVDAVYAIREGDASYLVSVEAKGRREPIWPMQVLRAARALAATEIGGTGDGVIPFAIKVVDESLLYTVEFEPVVGDAPTALTKAADGVVQLVPPVQGIR